MPWFTVTILVWSSINILSSVVIAKKICPPAKDLTLCSCEQMQFVDAGPEPAWVTVRCANVTDVTTFVRELKKFGDLLIISLELNHFNLNSLPKSIFKGLSIETIELNHGKFKSLVPEDDPGSWFEGSLIEVLDVNFVNISVGHFDWSVLETLYDMKHLWLIESKVERYSRWDSLGRMTNLTSFTLTGNNLTRINRAVSRLTDLIALDMARNSIPEISRNSFPKPANRLAWLDLGYNKIKELPYDIFEEMPRLKYIELKFNQLSVISQDIFVPVAPNLHALLIYGNPIRCDNGALWMLRTIYKNPDFGGVNDFKYTKCDSPYKIKGKKLKELMESDLEINNGIAK